MYGTINSGAHRQAAELIGAPAFVWHMAFWNPEHGDAERTERAARLGSFIRAVHDGIGRIPGTDCHVYGGTLDVRPTALDVRPMDRAEVKTFVFNWNDMRAKIRFEIHGEYLSIRSVIDASLKVREDQESDNKLFNDVKNNLGELIRHVCPTGATPKPTHTVDELHQFIYHDIWELNWFGQILNVGIENVGHIFAEFRGFITCEQYPSKDEQDKDPSKDEQDKEIFTKESYEHKPIQGPFHRIKEDARAQWQRTSIPDQHWARHRLDAMWPFLSVESAGEPASMTPQTEFTVSRVLSGRALYVSALGPQPMEGVQGTEQPVYFYIHSVTKCERQIGRLVDRFLLMGTLRLAAIIAVPALKAVGAKMEGLEKDIATARKHIHELIQFAKSSAGHTLQGQKEIDTQEEIILGELGSIQNTIAALSEGRDPPDGEYLGSAPIEYRLMRSRLYKSMFFELMDGLRIVRLEGYQPYDVFVQRRLGSAFRFIEGIELRIEQIEADWLRVDQLYLTTTVTLLTENIEGLTQNIEEQQEEAIKVGNTIESIQAVGETLLIGFITPYYFAHLLFYVLDCEHNMFCKGDVGEFTRIQAGATFVWLFWFVAAAGRWIYLRVRERQRRFRETQKSTIT